MHAGRALIVEPKPKATGNTSPLLLGVWSAVSAEKSKFGFLSQFYLRQGVVVLFK